MSSPLALTEPGRRERAVPAQRQAALERLLDVLDEGEGRRLVPPLEKLPAALSPATAAGYGICRLRDADVCRRQGGCPTSRECQAGGEARDPEAGVSAWTGGELRPVSAGVASVGVAFAPARHGSRPPASRPGGTRGRG